MHPNPLYAGLTAQQFAAVMHEHGPARVAAGAGSGKTSVIVRRIARLVLEKGVDPTRILAVTFSKAGAEEMTSRLSQFCNAEVRTFHALALRICKTDLWGPGMNVGDARYSACVKQATEEQSKKSARKIDPAFVHAFIDLAKSQLLLPEYADKAALEQLVLRLFNEQLARAPFEVETQDFLEAYLRAEELRAERRIVTFACMICHAVRFLRDNEAARLRWASKFDFVIQDEAQDQSPDQLLFASLLARDHGNYMIVGDIAQTIYAFRGADPDFMVRFPLEWPGAVNYPLETNFRSGTGIVDLANTLCKNMPTGTHLGIEMNSARQTETLVDFCRDTSSSQEAARIAREIASALRGEGVHMSMPDDFAVLLRVAASSSAIEEHFIRQQIPYHLAVGVSFFGRKEVAALLSYLRIVAGTFDDEDIDRSLKAPNRFVSNAFIQVLQDELRRQQAIAQRQPDMQSLVDRALRKATLRGGAPRAVGAWAVLLDSCRQQYAKGVQPEALLRFLIERTDYVKWLNRDEGFATEDEDRADNVARLVERAAAFPTFEQLFVFVDHALAQPTTSGKVSGRVTITTIHRAKGLEWPVVYLPLFSEGTIPHKRAQRIEERRLAYVAFTRARDELRISCPRIFRYSPEIAIPIVPSSFLPESGIDTADDAAEHDAAIDAIDIDVAAQHAVDIGGEST